MSKGNADLPPHGRDNPDPATARDTREATADLPDPSAIHGGRTVEMRPDEIERAAGESRWDESSPGRVPPLLPAGYQLTVLVGQGTFGEVWRGVNAAGVQVAVKFLLHTHDRARLHCLREETQKLALLHSDPRIVRLLEVNETATPPYFVMDFAEQGSLAFRLEGGPLPARQALRLFRQVVEAMAYVHAKGIRHCDLKPGNILLDAAGRPRVADFGQAQLSVEPTTAALGTFFYMAPEQARAERQVPDAAWDVYGLGALLYAMLTGAPPRYDRRFQAELEQTAHLPHRLERYRRWVETSPVPAAHRKVEGVDRDLAGIIDRCLAADPAARFRDAGDVLAALDARDRRRRSRPLVLFGIVAPLVLLVALVAAGLVGAYRTRAAVRQADARLAEHKAKVDQVSAELVADILEEKLRTLRTKLALFARSENLRRPLLKYLAARDKADLGEVEQFLERLGQYEEGVHLFGVYDRTATLCAGWLRSPEQARAFPRGDYGATCGHRDFWTHHGDEFPAPPGPWPYLPYTEKTKDGVREVPYISQPYANAVGEPFAAFSLSMPIYRDQDAADKEMVGLLVACVKLDEFNDWLDRLDQKDGCVVLLDPRGYCMHHRQDLRPRYEPRPGENPRPLKDANLAYRQVLGGLKGVEAEHEDPFDGRTYTATFEPVENFAWGVIVQYDRRADEVRTDLGDVSAHLELLFWGGLTAGLIVIVGFWGWLVWTLRHKEAVGHG
jgi:hypothetical protein